MIHYLYLPISRGYTLQVVRDTFQDRPRIDIRVWAEYRPGDRDSAQATKQGVSIKPRLLPALRAALEEAERSALEDGLLSVEDYARSGVPLPPDRQDAA